MRRFPRGENCKTMRVQCSVDMFRLTVTAIFQGSTVLLTGLAGRASIDGTCKLILYLLSDNPFFLHLNKELMSDKI